MSDAIKRVAEAMQQLPDENQNAIAQYIEAMLRLSNDTRQLMKEHLLEEIKEQEQSLHFSA